MTQKIFKEHDRSRGICQTCKKVVTTEFLFTQVTLVNPSTVTPPVLAATCTECGNVVGIPAQSSEAIRAHRQKISLKD